MKFFLVLTSGLAAVASAQEDGAAGAPPEMPKGGATPKGMGGMKGMGGDLGAKMGGMMQMMWYVLPIFPNCASIS